jgi:hypothetical protein
MHALAMFTGGGWLLLKTTSKTTQVANLCSVHQNSAVLNHDLCVHDAPAQATFI